MRDSINKVYEKMLNEAKKGLTGRPGKSMSGVGGVVVKTEKGGAPYTFMTLKQFKNEKEITTWVKEKLKSLGDTTKIISVKPF